jgi:hypothetical protein
VLPLDVDFPLEHENHAIRGGAFLKQYIAGLRDKFFPVPG